MIRCVQCGAVLGEGRRRKFCSKKCNKAYSNSRRARKRADLITCEECGNAFTPANSLHRFCSDACRPWKSFTAEPVERSCVCCGSRHTRPKFCSQRCAQRWARRKYRHRRRARRVEDYDPLVIYERDGWRCQICGDPLLRSRQWPHPKYPTLDHIVPLSSDAAEAVDASWNVQAACWDCNRSKGMRYSPNGDQLMLAV